MTQPRHFLDIDRFDAATLRVILDRAIGIKHGTKMEGGAKCDGTCHGQCDGTCSAESFSPARRWR